MTHNTSAAPGLPAVSLIACLLLAILHVPLRANNHPLPSTEDLWDVSQGVVVTGTSGIRFGFDALDMFGAENSPIGPGHTIFADDQPPGFVHYIEWQTTNPVLVGRINLFAAGDSPLYLNQREFDRFVLRAKSPGSATFDMVVIDYTPTHPYELLDQDSSLLLSARISPFRSQEFRAEFTQFTAGRGYDGPRIFELDAFGPDCVPLPAGVVAWWRGEDNASDQVGSNHGTLLGDASYGDGQVGRSFVFDGDHDGISVGDAPELRLQDFTIEGWIRRSSATQASFDPWDSGCIFAHSWGGFGLALTDAGELFLSKIGSSGVFSTLAITETNQFHHVAVTKTGATVVFYLNGESQTAAPYDPGFTFNGPAAIGARGTDLVASFYGSIDELGIYNRALAAAEIQAIHQAGALGKCPPTSSRQPLARWAFDESEGNTARDSVGTRHGALSAAGAEFTADGVRGNALRLNRAEGGYVNMGNGLDLTEEFTLVAWVKTEVNDTTETMVIAGKHAAGTANGYYLALNRSGFIGQPGKALFVASDSAGEELVSTSVVNDGQWHQVVAVYEGGLEKRLYVDGQPAEASRAATAILPNDAPFLVGGVSVTGLAQGFFNGWIDELQIYDRALADVEIEYLFLHPDAEQIPPLLEPRIATGLLSQTVNRGATVEWSVEVTGQEPLRYEWTKDGMAIEDADGPWLVLSDAQPADRGVYSVAISNPWGEVTSSATLQVLWPPTIVVSPLGETVPLGSSTTLSVTAEGASPLSYQWMKNGRPVAGGIGRFLLLNNVTASTAGIYQVRVQNPDGVVMSDPATLQVYSGSIRVELSESRLQFHVSGLQPGRNYVLEFTTVLPATRAPWETLATVLEAAESFQFTDPDPPVGNRYYRLRLVP
jgi:hypothetical protein